jgi:YegS/Rv2252/BmrU family lipid kinase
MRRLVLVVNPVSGRGRAARVAERAARQLKAAGIEAQIYATRHAGDARESAPALAAEADAVVAVGGDGTLAEVVAGLDGTEFTAGVIPCGTANVVARELKIPLSMRGAVRVLVQGSARRFDLGRANGRPFLAMVGVGLDGAIVHALSAARRGPISMATYVKPTLGVLRTWTWPALQVEVDGRLLPEPCYGAIVSNTANYGGIFALLPKAQMNDGELDVQLWRKQGFIPALRIFARGLLHMPGASPMALVTRARKVRITAMNHSPVAAQCDGDILGVTPVEIELRAGAMRMIAP